VEKRVEFGQRRANAAVTLLRWGEREKTLAVFGMTDDPEALTQFIFRCRPRGVGVEALLDCLEIVSTAPPGRYAKESRYALLLALAEFRLSEVPENRRPSVLKQVRDWYANDPSSGVHGAANWLLRQWGENAYVKQIDETPMAPSADREWFTLAVKVKPEAPSSPLSRLFESKSATPTTFYYTFVVFPAGEYTIGSPENEPGRSIDETRVQVTLSRPFALLNREVTFAELIAFQRDKYENLMKVNPQYLRPDWAGAAVDWYDAVQFSRWLGTQLDPPLSEADQAYADPNSPTSGERESVSEASWAPRNWPVDVSRRGFRLPSEAEFEIACRSGVLTSYGFGSDVGLLDRYGWYQANSGKRMHEPMELRPGHRGLFDMHGNALEWVHDWNAADRLAGSTDPLGAKQGSLRVRRGGGWIDLAASCRSAHRGRGGPSGRASILGFRLALSFVGVPGEPRGDKKD
jgi:formylglycine-generating enzyme required for sulfatase activity